MENKKITIKYLDSTVYHGENLRSHDFKPCIFTATGFLIKEDNQSLTLAQEVRYDESFNEHKVRNVLVVPKCAIIDQTND